MATTAVGANWASVGNTGSILTATFELNLENNFGIDFNDPSSNGKWTNPFRNAIIKPYVPSDDQEMTLTCQKVLGSNMADSLTGADNDSGSRFTLDPITCYVISLLDPKDVANLAETSKCCYSATKINFIWEVQLYKLFPNVKNMDNALCSFSPEQQFKVYFKRMNDELKPYTFQFKSQDGLLKELRGPNGMDGTIHAAWQELEKEGGMSKGFELVQGGIYDAKSIAAISLYNDLNLQRIDLAGNNYNGTHETINPASLQGRCLNAINNLVPQAFDDQERFEQTIQRAEVAKNGTPETESSENPDTIDQDDGVTS